jgi:DNA-binding MarR family transcriptional regulator
MAAGMIAQGPVNPHKAILAPRSASLEAPVKPERHGRRLGEIIELAKVIRRHGDLMTPQAFQIVMEIALEPGITMSSLEQRTGLSHASISRNLSALSDWHRLGKQGLGFVEKVQDPTESRRQIAFLTSKGRQFVEEALSAGRPADERCLLDAPSSKDFVNKTHRSRSR